MAGYVIDTKPMREAAELTRQRGNVVMAVYVLEHIALLDEIERLREDLQATKLRADANAAMFKATHDARAQNG